MSAAEVEAELKAGHPPAGKIAFKIVWFLVCIWLVEFVGLGVGVWFWGNKHL